MPYVRINDVVQWLEDDDPILNTDLTWDDIREDRDARLAASDWTQLDDCPLGMSKKVEWVDYRQDLRDVPDEFSSPDLVVWPSEPL